jgi:hypothetical protein
MKRRREHQKEKKEFDEVCYQRYKTEEPKVDKPVLVPGFEAKTLAWFLSAENT